MSDALPLLTRKCRQTFDSSHETFPCSGWHLPACLVCQVHSAHLLGITNMSPTCEW